MHDDYSGVIAINVHITHDAPVHHVIVRRLHDDPAAVDHRCDDLRRAHIDGTFVDHHYVDIDDLVFNVDDDTSGRRVP